MSEQIQAASNSKWNKRSWSERGRALGGLMVMTDPETILDDPSFRATSAVVIPSDEPEVEHVRSTLDPVDEASQTENFRDMAETSLDIELDSQRKERVIDAFFSGWEASVHIRSSSTS